MVCMPGGRAGSSEAQPISCHIAEALLVGLLLRGDTVVELVSITQLGILEEDAGEENRVKDREAPGDQVDLDGD